MKLLLDQMLDESVRYALLEAGHDAVRVSSLGLARADDSEILAMAIHESRTLVTLDEHFGDWVVLPLDKHPGVIRIKVISAVSETILAVLMPLLAKYSRKMFDNKLVIAGEKGARWITTSSSE